MQVYDIYIWGIKVELVSRECVFNSLEVKESEITQGWVGKYWKQYI